MSTKIAVIGKGNVGGALANGLKNANYEVNVVGNDKVAVEEAAAWAEVIVLAVPFAALTDISAAIKNYAEGKVVIDATNAIDAEMKLVVGFSTSGAEELQKNLPGARVVKAFNTVFAQHMDTGRLGDQTLSAFVASDNDDAKALVAQLARDIGFDAIDAGPLANARHLEPLAYFNIQLGYVLGLGTQIGFKLLHD